MSRIRVLLAVVLVLVLLAGCGSGGVNLEKAGFTRMHSEKDGDVTVTVYTGSATRSEALDVFTNWAKSEGWTETVDMDYMAGYSGKMFEKGNNMLIVSIIEAGPMTTVSVVTGPK